MEEKVKENAKTIITNFFSQAYDMSVYTIEFE